MRRALALVLLAATVFAQDETKPELHKIYVPYDKLDEVLGTDKERVMVPYREFLELWKLKYGPDRAADKPPVPYTVESAAYDGRVKEGIASFTVKIGIEIFEETWQRIHLPFSGVAFEEVTVDGGPGVIVPTRKGYDLILRGRGRHTMEASIVAGVAKGKEFATTSFGLPPVPLHRLTFRVPGKGTEVKIEPARAHTTVTEGDETVVLAFLGPQGNLKLTWRYQPEETEKEPPLVFANDLLDMRVEERVVRGTAQFDLEVLRAPTTKFQVRVPENVQVLEVTGANIKTWGFADKERRLLQVALHKEVTGRYGLVVGFEGPVEVPGALTVPTFRVEDAARERGFLRVTAAEGVGLRPVAAENVFQVDLNALPKAIRGGTRALGFRFPALPYSLNLKTERIAPLVSLTTRARLMVDRHTVTLDEALQFSVERAGIFGLTLFVPKGITLTQIGDAKLVDSWRESVEGDGRTFRIALRGRRIGNFTLQLKGVMPLDLAAGRLEVPLIKVADIDREEGTLGVFMHQGIKAEAEATGVVPVEPAKFQAEDRFAAPLPLAFAWRWRGGDAAVAFKVEARKPKVTAEARYTLQAEEARVSIRADLVYTVQYTGVESFRFRVPKRMLEKMKVDARNLREKSHVDDPVEEGVEPTATWTVALQSPALGQVAIQVEYDEVFPDALQVNQSRPARIPALVPLDVERTTTHVAIRKSPVIKVDAAAEGYTQIDVSELPKVMQGEDVFQALRVYEKPSEFLLGLTKHEYQPVADLVVRHTHLKTVVIDEGRASTIAFFELLNNDRQFLAVRLPKGSKVQELQVAGKPEKPRIGADGSLLVRLKTGLRKDATFQVALAYTHPISTSGAVGKDTTLHGPVLPPFEDAPAPFQALLTWSVHYPEAWRVTGFDGNVEPDREGEIEDSWLRRAIASLGRLIRPVKSPAARPAELAMPLGSFKDIVPTYTQRESVETLFSNGSGDGELTISHTTLTAQVIFILIALALSAAAVFGLSRFLKPFHAGSGIALVALLFLAVAGPGLAPVWNAVFFAALVTMLILMVLEIRRMKS